MEEMKKLLLATVGAATLSIEKIDSTLSELIERGKLTVKEGKELREELIKRNTKEEEEVLTRENLYTMIDSLNLVARRDLELLEEKVKLLEERIAGLESK